MFCSDVRNRGVVLDCALWCQLFLFTTELDLRVSDHFKCVSKAKAGATKLKFVFAYTLVIQYTVTITSLYLVWPPHLQQVCFWEEFPGQKSSQHDGSAWCLQPSTRKNNIKTSIRENVDKFLKWA